MGSQQLSYVRDCRSDLQRCGLLRNHEHGVEATQWPWKELETRVQGVEFFFKLGMISLLVRLSVNVPTFNQPGSVCSESSAKNPQISIFLQKTNNCYNTRETFRESGTDYSQSFYKIWIYCKLYKDTCLFYQRYIHKMCHCQLSLCLWYSNLIGNYRKMCNQIFHFCFLIIQNFPTVSHICAPPIRLWLLWNTWLRRDQNVLPNSVEKISTQSKPSRISST